MNERSAVLDDAVAAEPAESKAETPREKTGSRVLGEAVRRGRRVGDSAIEVKTLVTAVLVIVLVAAVAVLGWRLRATSDELDSAHSVAAGRAHAERVALDYAAAAADMDFRDLAAWRTRLTKGTSPELSQRLTQAASSMEQIIAPLQWVSTAKPIAAKVRSESHGVYAVDCFVSVLTKNSQAPDGIQSTATYQLSLDGGNDWAITEIGGIDSALGRPGAPR